jgi:hypothetical protein
LYWLGFSAFAVIAWFGGRDSDYRFLHGGSDFAETVLRRLARSLIGERNLGIGESRCDIGRFTAGHTTSEAN